MKSKLLGTISAALLAFTTVSVNAVSLGDLVISEVMANPSAVRDSTGEWFEIFNTRAFAIDLSGINLSDDGIDAHTINSGSSTIIGPGEYFV